MASPAANDPRVVRHRRMATMLSTTAVPHPTERAAAIAAQPLLRRRSARRELEAAWAEQEALLRADAEALVRGYEEVIATLDESLGALHLLGRVRFQGKVNDERARLGRARAELAVVRSAVQAGDVEAAGKAMQNADRELWTLGGPLTLVLNEELQQAAYSRELQAELSAAQARRREARLQADSVRAAERWPEALHASLPAYEAAAQCFLLIARAIGQPAAESAAGAVARGASGNAVHVVPPQELPRLDEVGGLDSVKDTLRRTVGLQLERPEDAVRYGVAANGVLLYGPPGTGKTLLARAVAGEYGLRYLRVSPSVIASPYAHETAKNLARVFEMAREAAPCVLFLDEIDALASARTGLPSAEHREVVTQLLTLLEDYRRIPRLVIMAATNALELLDTALREGRFDTQVQVPLPDAEARAHILTIHLRAREGAVAWDGVDIDEVARRTSGRSGAALEHLVTTAAEHAMREGRSITQQHLLAAVDERVGRDRVTLEEAVRWDDVVLPESLAKRLRQLLRVVQRPELAEAIGVRPPAGILLYGPPGTGKTTIAKALATEARASFYEFSAADLLSKWVGESEERVAKLFARARENRPSIVFIDEIESLLRRRSASSSSPWEERVVAQFLRELDGLRGGSGVFLVGATNRLDIIDEAIVERRLQALEVPLPDLEARRALLQRLFAHVRLDGDVNLEKVALLTDGMSGADLKHVRDEAGLAALSRTVNDDVRVDDIVICAADLYESLEERRLPVIPE